MAFLYVTEQGGVLKKSGQRLILEKGGDRLLEILASKIDGILIFGNVQVTTQALHLLFHHDIEMALLSKRGRLLGQLTSPVTKNIDLRKAQYARSEDPIFVLNFSRSIVKGKFANCLEFLREFRHNHRDSDLDEEISGLVDLSSKVDSQEDLASILGLEGAVARLYFQGFSKMIRHSFHFEGRKRRPAPDPVNALLSLGYTMVYNEISSLLDGMGFDPYMGFYHQPRYGHATLASDLMEEFRTPLTERFTLYLINNRVFKQEHFSSHAPSGGIYLRDAPRKRYFAEYEKFVTRPMSSSDNPKSTDFRGLFRKQGEQLRNRILLGGEYSPYRFSW